MNYATGLRRARRKSGLSQRKLAKKAGFDASYITMIEAGRRIPSIEGIERLAEAMEMPVSLLLLSCADQADLRGIKEQKARRLFEQLLDVLEGSGDGGSRR
jgi:transcriptional regulator with XRE-family HTH domain